MNNTNTLISGDNKGHASYLMERDMNKGALPGQVHTTLYMHYCSYRTYVLLLHVHMYAATLQTPILEDTLPNRCVWYLHMLVQVYIVHMHD